MCDACPTVDPLLLLHSARVAADQLLIATGRLPLSKALPLGKALHLSTPGGFDRAVAVLGARLRQAAGEADVAAVRGAMKVLDVDWPSTTAAQRRRLVSEALIAAGRATAIIPARIRVPLDDAAEAVVAATRKAVRREQGLDIRAELSQLDRRVVTHIARSQGNFVKDEYGRRVASFGEKARSLVAAGLEQGLGRDAISRDLAEAAEAALIHRAPFYWEVVASSFIGRGRSLGQMSSYQEAKIERYEIVAVLDERTTQICRFMHGQTFEVAAALDRFAAVEELEDPEEIKRLMPWARERRNPETGRTELYAHGRSGRTPIAEVTRSALGTRDDRGEFRALASERRLSEMGANCPPYHGLCRSCTVAVIT